MTPLNVSPFPPLDLAPVFLANDEYEVLTAYLYQVLTGSSDRCVHLFNPLRASSDGSSTGLIQSYNAHGYEVLDLAISNDNARFTSVGGDKQVFLWDVTTARTLRRWSGHFGRVNCVDFGGEEGSVVVSGSFDATVRVWDAKSQNTKPVQILEDARDSILSVSVNRWEILTGSVDGRIRAYDIRMGTVHIDHIGRVSDPLPFLGEMQNGRYANVYNQIPLRRYSRQKTAMQS